MTPTVLAFDINETLLDLRALGPLFEDAFGDAALRSQWFSSMLMLSFTGAITGEYVDFSTAQFASLEMLSQRTGRVVSKAQADAIVGQMDDLAPHADVDAGLGALRDAGFRLVALGNSLLKTVEAQLSNAGIRQHFEAVYSADEVHRLKPAPEPYHMVANRSGVQAEQVWLVAAHAWDVSGALAAGCHAAFVARPGQFPSPIGTQPDVVVADLGELRDAVGERLSESTHDAPRSGER